MPGGYVYEIDPAMKTQWGEVPPFAIKGGRKVDDAGKLTDEYKINPNYDHAKTLEWVAQQSNQEVH